MLPAWIAKGLTVVIVPLIALRADLQQRCTTLGISCVEWESRRPPDEASIVLVTPESALTGDFRTFLNRQRMIYRLDRIVIDECHILIQPGSSFRPMIKYLGQLIGLSVQMLLLTATLPPTLEDRLWRRLRVTREQVFLHRDRTTRSNISYRVWRPEIPYDPSQGSDWLTDPSVIQFIQTRIQLSESGRTIIYGSTVDHIEIMARYLQCEAFHRSSYDQPGILARFRQGTGKAIVCINALGVGVDIPDVRCVIYLGWPRTLLDYGQESGRAGRDGQPSEAIIIQPSGLQ